MRSGKALDGNRLGVRGEDAVQRPGGRQEDLVGMLGCSMVLEVLVESCTVLVWVKTVLAPPF